MTEITGILGIPGNVPNIKVSFDERGRNSLAFCRRDRIRGEEVRKSVVRRGEQLDGVI